MVNFAESDYNRQMRRYEDNLAQAKASDNNARQDRMQQLEDDLVAGGLEEIQKYIQTLNERWKKARCLAEYDGFNMGYAIVKRAKQRIDNINEVYN